MIETILLVGSCSLVIICAIKDARDKVIEEIRKEKNV